MLYSMLIDQVISSSIRPLSTSHHAQSRQASPAPIPTTTPTITSNVTASPPPSDFPSDAVPDTSLMQKTISANLGQTPSLSTRLARKLRSSAIGGITDSYVTYGLTEQLFKICARQAEYTIPEDQRMGIYTGKGPPKNADQEDVGVRSNEARDSDGRNFWFDTLGLEPTFSTWSQVSFLHMYILTVKLRTLPTNQDFLNYQRYLLEHFSNTAEDKMGLLHGMVSRGIRNRYLKEMFIQWRGVLYAYDQGLVQGDAVLAAAVWRNVWKAKEDVDWTKVAMVVGFMRRAISGLEQMTLSGATISDDFWESCRAGLAEEIRSDTTAKS